MKVECEIHETELENDSGRTVDGVIAECSRCGHREESFGTSEASRKRCLVMLRENCPKGELNFYVEEI
jgi:hypothetical protein